MPLLSSCQSSPSGGEGPHVYARNVLEHTDMDDGLLEQLPLESALTLSTMHSIQTQTCADAVQAL